MVYVIVYKKQKKSKIIINYINLIVISLSINSLPETLIVQLKRFKYDEDKFKKISYFINIPHEINLNILLYDNNKKKNCLYMLNSLIIHVGCGTTQGHYFSIIKKSNEDNSSLSYIWYKVDDEKVIELNDSDLDLYMGNMDETYFLKDSSCVYVALYTKNNNFY